VLAESDPHPLCNQCGARRGLQDVSATAADRLVGGRVMGRRELLDDPNARRAGVSDDLRQMPAWDE
jgi:hypothetical protein